MRGILVSFLIIIIFLLLIGGCVTKNAPQVVIISPKSEDVVFGTVNIEAQVTVDKNSNVSSVEFYVDDTRIGIKTQEPYKCSWNTEGFETGNHTITVKAYDNNGNVSSASINVGKNAFIKWVLDTGYVYACPAIGYDGTIYVIGNKLYAINPNGTVKWSNNPQDGSYNYQASPVIGDDGTIYVVSGNNASLYARDSTDGSLKWVTAVGKLYNYLGNIASSIDSNGNIYIGNNEGYLYSLDANGNIRWIYTCGQRITSYPVVGKNDNVYVFCRNDSSEGVFYSISSDGDYRWSYTFPINEWCVNSPSIDGNGNIYLPISAGTYGKIYKFDKDGNSLWNAQVSGNIYYSPIFDNSGYLYVCGGDTIYKILADNGSIVKYTSTGYQSSTVISQEGIIYLIGIVSGKYALLAMDSSDLSIKWSLPVTQAYYITLSNDGVLYFGSPAMKLYSVKVNSTGLLNSPWPKYRKDLKNIGRAE